MVEISTRSSSGWVLDDFLDRTWSYLFPKLFCNTRITFSSVPTNNAEKSQKPDFHGICSHTWSSSGWVPTIRKVLPSESMSSHEHFSYISCLHIFKRSTVILSFAKKTTPLVSYNEMHHPSNSSINSYMIESKIYFSRSTTLIKLPKFRILSIFATKMDEKMGTKNGRKNGWNM